MDTNFKLLQTLGAEQILEKLESTTQGLSNSEAKKRKVRYGTNELVRRSYHSIFLEALSHSTNPLVAILLIAASVSAFTGNITNSSLIILILIFSIGLDYYQSHRALVTVKKLQQQIAATASVLRDSQWVELPCRELVPGDIIRLVAGDLVPADTLLLNAKDLHVQQAALTGESLPVEKEAFPPAILIKNIVDAQNVVFSGSSIISGVATGVVVNTGSSTLFGNIADSLKKPVPRTEFEKGTILFGMFIMKTVFFLVIFVFVVNIYLKHSLIESLLFAMALAVGLTPELLPMITTVTLAAGAVHMAKKKVIVKNLQSIQNFSSIDILCSDKTGTLTSGEMILDQYIDPLGKKNEYVMLLAYLNSFYGTEVSNPFNTAVLKNASINPLDSAILKHAHPDIQPYSKIDEIPFDFERRRSSVVVERDGAHLLITKGAPEYVMNICTSSNLDEKNTITDDKIKKQCDAIFRSLSQKGYRVLAIACRNLTKIQSTYHSKDEKDMVLIGFLAFYDPPLNN